MAYERKERKKKREIRRSRDGMLARRKKRRRNLSRIGEEFPGAERKYTAEVNI